jgi:hypothetical protein
MSIFSDVFAVYERLASAKMNLLKDSINSHTHDGINGIKIPFKDLYDHILDEQFTDNSVNGDAIMTNTIPATKIMDYSITMQQIDRVSSNGLKFSTDGYAVYAP